MRHAIVVIGSEEQRLLAPPKVRLLDDETVRQTNWYACDDQEAPNDLLDDCRSIVLRILRAPVLAYHFYLLVHNTKLWGGKRPLVLLRDRALSSRIAAYAGSWGGGDIIKAGQLDEPPLGPTRYILQPDGKLELRDT
jgi:hypothetical protein